MDISPIEQYTYRIVRKEIPSILARKLKCSPRKKEIKLINNKVLVYKLAFAILSQKLKQYNILLIYRI